MLPAEWTYEHELCTGDGMSGSMWECPLLAKVPPMPLQVSAEEVSGSPFMTRLSPK